jgi:phosphinothricin acetyltransferase
MATYSSGLLRLGQFTHPHGRTLRAFSNYAQDKRAGATVIRTATLNDATAIAAIYNPYIAETTITFEEQPVSTQEIEERISKVLAAGLPYLVVEHEERVCGYAYATPWRVRSAYRFSTETTIYIGQSHVGMGLGASLYQELLSQLCSYGAHVAIGGIALPNSASVALHEKLGFKKVAHFAEVGMKFGRWVDVGYWQKTLAIVRE